MDSPLARALLAKHVDDEVVVRTGEKTTVINILSIQYQSR